MGFVHILSLGRKDNMMCICWLLLGIGMVGVVVGIGTLNTSHICAANAEAVGDGHGGSTISYFIIIHIGCDQSNCCYQVQDIYQYRHCGSQSTV